MLVDDGSTDNTREITEQWQRENTIEIIYLFKENGGMHTAHNLAYQNINTELNVCIDSDDWLPENAVELILNKWKNAAAKENLAGIIGLDAHADGRLVGTAFPENVLRGPFFDTTKKHKVTGDKKFVLRTDIVRKYPAYPEYPGEKLVALGILYLMIEKDFDYLFSNEVYCIVEYQPDGSSNSIFRQYKQSPRGFAYERIQHLKLDNDFEDRFRNAVHLVSSAIFAKDYRLLFKSNKTLMVLCALPFGVLLNLFIRYKIKNA